MPGPHRITGPLWGESTCDQCTPLKKPVTQRFDAPMLITLTGCCTNSGDVGDFKRYGAYHCTIFHQTVSIYEQYVTSLCSSLYPCTDMLMKHASVVIQLQIFGGFNIVTKDVIPKYGVKTSETYKLPHLIISILKSNIYRWLSAKLQYLHC